MGIGPAAALKASGVTVLHDLPGVGQNLQDHLMAIVQFRVRETAAASIARPTERARMAPNLIT